MGRLPLFRSARRVVPTRFGGGGHRSKSTSSATRPAWSRRGAIREQVELLLLDLVLNLAAGAVDVLIEDARIDRVG